jgi:hypothetical protein
MRIVKAPEDGSFKKIAKAIMNVEAGTDLFDEGFKGNVHVINDVRTTIKSTYGIIYTNLDGDMFVHKLLEELIPLEAKFPDHLMNYTAIKEISSAFSIVKTKNTSHLSGSSAHGKRSFYVGDFCKLKYEARFLWYVLSFDKLFHQLESPQYNNIPKTMQLVSIAYDEPNGYFESDMLLSRELLITDIAGLAGVGTFRNKLEVEPVAEFNPRMCKRCEAVFSSEVKMRTHARLETCIETDKKNDTVPPYPEIIYGWNYGDDLICLCPIRGAIFEIQRIFQGRKFAYWYTNVPIKTIKCYTMKHDLELTLKKDFDEVLFGNTVSFKSNFKKEDVCQRCMIPLYDDIYVFTTDGKTGYPQCPTCVHEISLMFNTHKIVRQKFKLTYKDVIEAIPDNIFINEKYKQVLLNINSDNFRRFNEQQLYVHEETQTIGIPAGLTYLIEYRIKLIKFLGWTPKFIFRYTLITE